MDGPLVRSRQSLLPTEAHPSFRKGPSKRLRRLGRAPIRLDAVVSNYGQCQWEVPVGFGRSQSRRRKIGMRQCPVAVVVN